MRLLPVILLLLGTFSQAASIDFVGLRSFTEKALEEAIAGRLDYISRPRAEATAYRADDAAYLVESYLRLHGFPDATVSGAVTTSKRILLTVDEGLSQFLGPITVVGFPKAKEIQSQFQAPFPETDQRRAFQADAVATGLARIIDLLHADGYWSGTVTATRGTRNAQNEIPFTLKVTTGPLFTLSTPALETSVPPTEELRTALLGVSGDPATAEKINATRNSISTSYRRRGYNEISVEMARELSGTRLKLFFTITPGTRHTVNSFTTKGLKKTKPELILKRFDGLVGEDYDENYLNEEIKKLLSTGAFRSIRLESNEEIDTKLDLTLNLIESKARGYSFSLGYGSIEGYVIGARYYDRNLWGRLWNLSAGLEITGLGGLGEVSLANPFFLNKELNLANRAFLISRNFDNYRKVEGGIGSELSWRHGTWKPGKKHSSAFALNFSQNSITSSLPDELIGPQDYFVNRLSFRQIFDHRNDQALPSDGWYARFESSLGFATGEGGISFFETEGQISYYKSIKDESFLALGLRGGLIIPSAEDQDLPIDLRKFLGGANTIRSFPELEMGPSFDGDALGGTAWWVANAEYTRILTGPVKGLVFFDAASLDSEVELAVGLGIRVDLPVGPIRLEYGHSLTRDSGEPAGAFHFAIGTTF